jgi:hypothetical protein
MKITSTGGPVLGAAALLVLLAAVVVARMLALPPATIVVGLLLLLVGLRVGVMVAALRPPEGRARARSEASAEPRGLRDGSALRGVETLARGRRARPSAQSVA